MVCEYYSDMTIEKIYGSIMNTVNSECIKNRGNPFSCLPETLTFRFYEQYNQNSGFFGSTWKLEGKESAIVKAKPVMSRIRAVIKRLPQGIQVSIVSDKEDPRENARFIGTSAIVCVIYKIKISVAVTYAEVYYKSVCDGGIVHDVGMKDSFKQKAYSFYTLLKGQHMETLGQIVNEINGKHLSDFYVWPDKIEYGRGIPICCFKDYGMAPLPSREATYGMAMALVEEMTKNIQQQYKLSEYTHFVAVEKLRCPPPMLKEW